MKVELDLIDLNSCQQTLDEYEDYKLTSNQLCAYAMDADTCQGGEQ